MNLFNTLLLIGLFALVISVVLPSYSQGATTNNTLVENSHNNATTTTVETGNDP